MAGTFSQIYIQVVFAVKGRQNLIHATHEEELYRYIAGIIEAKGQKTMMPNHIHLFVGIKPSISISDLVRDVKNNSSKFINEKNWIQGKFSWQEGYGAFSYSKSHIDKVYNYILNQKEHHKNKTFKEEYIGLLDAFKVEYEERYLFDWLE